MIQGGSSGQMISNLVKQIQMKNKEEFIRKYMTWSTN